MNNAILMGRLTRDPELRYIQGGNQAVARFTLAVDKQLLREKKQEMESKNQPTADFINIVVWGKLAENTVKFTEKGKRVAVTGSIQTSSYEDKDGKRVYTTDVVASNIEFIDWKNNNQNSNSSNENFNEAFEFGVDFDPSSDDGRIPF